MTAPEVRPFEFRCPTCGVDHKQVSVAGLIPLTQKDAATLAFSILAITHPKLMADAAFKQWTLEGGHTA